MLSSLIECPSFLSSPYDRPLNASAFLPGDFFALRDLLLDSYPATGDRIGPTLSSVKCNQSRQIGIGLPALNLLKCLAILQLIGVAFDHFAGNLAGQPLKQMDVSGKLGI